MYKLVITELAQSDLDDIVSYIAVNLSTAAGDFLDEAEKCYSHLRNNPFILDKIITFGLKEKVIGKQ